MAAKHRRSIWVSPRRTGSIRVFEVLASGALLTISLPNELTELGFQDEVHFVGYREGREIIPLTRVYLTDETARLCITQAARAKILKEHTYDALIEQLLGHLERVGSAELALARPWPERRVRPMYLDFFCIRRSFQLLSKAIPAYRRK